MRRRSYSMRAWAVGLAVFASPPAAADTTADDTDTSESAAALTENAAAPTENTSTAGTTEAIATIDAELAAAEAELAQLLPSPRMDRAGAVPLSEPIAPVPPGEAAWLVSGAVRAGLADAFYGKTVLEVSARRGFGTWSVEAFGGPAFSWEGPALDLCRQAGTCTTPTGQQLGATPGQLEWLAGAGAVARFGLGKISFAGLPATNFAIEAGAAPMAIGYRLDVGGTTHHVAPGGRFALGLGVDLSPGVALRGEWQGIGYLPNLRGNTTVETQMLVGLALAWRPGVTP